MDIVIKIVQLLLSLSILVILHEFGHFMPARWFNTRVEKFYLFFDPWFSIFKYKKNDTEYGIGWLPLGGYVKISGMIDESMDKEQMKKPAEPWEFRSKTAGQRLVIMLGGVTMNVIFAIFIYIIMLFAWGEEFLPNENVKYGITCDSLALDLGLNHGDKIVSINNEEIKNFNEITGKIILDAETIKINRNGEIIDLTVPQDFVKKVIEERASRGLIHPRFPFDVDGFSADSIAEQTGIMKGDRIIGLNDTFTFAFIDFRNEIIKYKADTINMLVLRDVDTVVLPVFVPESGIIGIRRNGDLKQYFDFEKKEYGFFAAIPAGTAKTYKTFVSYIKQFQLLFKPETEAYKSLGGFITIGNLFPSEWDWRFFWNMTAFLSIMLAFLNILPIPALDGGHVMFLLYEVVSGRKPSEKFMEYAQTVGMLLLFALLIFANGNDIFRLFN